MSNIENEIWSDIEGYEGCYQISNLGRVKSCSRYRRGRGDSLVLLHERIMKTKITRTGYETVHLKSKLNKHTSVHRLIAKAFIPNPENKATVNHIDGNKLNNSISNLEWATDSEQMIHAISTGLYKPPCLKEYTRYGEDAYQCKIKQEDVQKIKQMRSTGATYKLIGECFGLGISQVFRICKDQSWSWLKEKNERE